jgi:phytoene dehydrogenase-like protein
MTDSAKTLIVGAGHNGLVCGAYLARAGHSVEIVEARDCVGGAAARRPLADGFRVPGLTHITHSFHPQIVEDLGLSGLNEAGVGSLDTISLQLEGRHIKLGADEASGAELTTEDLGAYRTFKKEFRSYANALDPLIMNKPPRLKDMDFKDKSTLARLGLKMRFGLGKRSMQEFLRVGGANIHDVLNEVFEHEGLKGAIAADAVLGHHMGPRTPSTVLTYLTRLYGESHNAGGRANLSAASIAGALERAATEAGVSIRLNAPVEEILVEDGRTRGVRLASGELIEAEIVISNADAKTTFLRLAGARHLDAMFTHRISKQRTNGTVAKLHLALSGKPEFEGLDETDLGHRLLIAPDMRYVEHAFNHAKYGEFSDHPVLEMTLPTLGDPGLAPDGCHILSVNASFAPCELGIGWEAGREIFIEKTLDAIEDYAPAIRSLILKQEFLSPQGIEREYGNTGGHWHHGEMGIDQSFMMRPVHGAAQYDTPVDGLFLCGAAAHPGGGITGIPGRNAAKRILALGV